MQEGKLDLAGRRLLLVNTGSPRKRFVLRRLRQLGLEIICVNPKVNWAKPYIDHWILANNKDHIKVLERIYEFIAANPNKAPEGALTFWEDDVLLTSKITESLGLVGIPFDIASRARNKSLFRAFCSEHGLPSPKFAVIPSLDHLDEALKRLRFPLVVKPVFGASSAYVIKVDDRDELERTLAYLWRSISQDVESALADGRDVMIEEYIEGDEVDIDILLQNGKLKFWSMSDNDQTNEPFFLETGQSIPSQLPLNSQRALLEMAEETLERLGVRNGCIHFEAKASPSGPVPIEVNLRMGGDEVCSFVKGAWDVDLVEYAARIALGCYFPAVKKPESPKAFLTGRYFLSEHSGILSKLNLPEDIRKIEGVQEFHFFKKVGDAVLVPPDGYDYLGWITTAGSNPAEAQSRLEKAGKKIEFEVSRFHAASSIGQTVRRNQFSYASLKKTLLTGAARIEHLRKIPFEQQRNIHIGIASNIYENTGMPIEDELTSDALRIQETLQDRGYEVSFFDFNNPPLAIDQLRSSPVGLIFNVCERLNGSSLLEPHAAAILDILAIPYTGSNPFTLSLCIDKIRVKKLLAYHGIPTPKWDYLYSMDDSLRDDLKYPLIVKPANSDSSIGITNDSVVTNPQELQRQLERVVLEMRRPALVEEYIEGDEYDVSIMGSEEDDLVVLPLSRSIFDKMPSGYWHIYPFEAKFAADPVYRESILVQRPPKNVNSRLLSLVSEIALDTYNILGCHDYGRVELRVDKNNNPFVLELNPNPSIGEKDCLPQVAKLAGFDYGDFLEEIIRLAVKRYKDRPPYFHLQANLL